MNNFENRVLRISIHWMTVFVERYKRRFYVNFSFHLCKRDELEVSKASFVSLIQAQYINRRVEILIKLKYLYGSCIKFNEFHKIYFNLSLEEYFTASGFILHHIGSIV